MKVKRLIIAAALLVVCAGAASAQTTMSPAWTFGGTGGYGRTWDDEGQIGSGVLVGAYADRRIFEGTDLELSADYLRHKRSAGRHSRRVQAIAQPGARPNRRSMLGSSDEHPRPSADGFPAS